MQPFTAQVDCAALFIHSELFYEVSSNSVNDVFNAAPTHPLGCLCSRFVAAEALQATLLLFTATLRFQMSRCTHKQQLHANITVPLLNRASCNYIMSQAFTCGEQALVLGDNSPRPQCFLAALWSS